MRDFFVSYTGKDKDYATWIATMLEKLNYSVTIQAWDFRPGDNLVSKINDSLINCKKLIITLSESYLKSKWCEAEWTTKLYEQITTGDNKIVPVRVEPVNLPGMLANIIYIDLVDKSEEEARKELENGLLDKVMRQANVPFPIGYSATHKEIVNKYVVSKSKILFFKKGKTNICHEAKNSIHQRVTWFADEHVDIYSITDGIKIEMIDEQDSNVNFNLVFDKSFSKGDIVEYEYLVVLSNKHNHFKNFLSTQIIVPVEKLVFCIIFDDFIVEKVNTQILTDSLMNANNEEPIEHEYNGMFKWSINNPKLHYEYKVAW